MWRKGDGLEPLASIMVASLPVVTVRSNSEIVLTNYFTTVLKDLVACGHGEVEVFRGEARR